MSSTSPHVEPKPEFVRLETGGAAVGRSVGTVRLAVRRGEVPAVRDGKLLLVDLDALRRRFAPRPVGDAAR
jgi:hypothetical protein